MLKFPLGASLFALISAMAFAWAFQANAAADTDLRMRASMTPNSTPSANESWRFLTTVGVSEESLIQNSPVGDAANDEARISLGVKLDPAKSAQWRATINARGGFSAVSGGRESNVEVPEANLAWWDAPQGANSTRIVLGRKIEAWSHMDSYWSLGLWQPFNRFDSLHPSEQGLTGAYLIHDDPQFKLVLFGSSLFLPDQGPAFELVDGRFHSKNPWFAAPTDRMILLSQTKPIRYRIDMPETESVVENESIAALARWGASAGPSAQLAFTRKPRNQLALSFDGVSDLKSAFVTITPKVVYHEVTSAELTYSARSWRVRLEGLNDQPVNVADSVPSGLTGVRLEPRTYVSPSVEMALETMRARIKLAWLDSFGENSKVEGPLAGPENPFGPRTMFQKAASVEARGTVVERSTYRIEPSVRWIEEFADQGRIFSVETTYRSSSNWLVSAFADVLQSSLPEDQTSGFVSRFRGNDRGGLRYELKF